jgi:putative RecB family exonuclease
MNGVERLYHQAVEQLKLFSGMRDLKAQPVAVEPYFQIQPELGITLFGRVDRIDAAGNGSLELIDYKTGADAEETDARQLRLYAIMAEASLGKPVSRLSFWYLADGSTATAPFTEADRQSTRSELISTIAEMEETTNFPPNIGTHCVYCPYLHACSERREIARRREAEGW